LGIICVHHRGGGLKKKSYFVDFFRRVNSFGYIFKILKTPFYTSFLGFIIYQNGLSCYMLLSEQLIVGSRIFSGLLLKGKKAKQVSSCGSSVLLSNVNLFSNVSILK
jgi:ribosomal protein L2